MFKLKLVNKLPPAYVLTEDYNDVCSVCFGVHALIRLSRCLSCGLLVHVNCCSYASLPFTATCNVCLTTD